MTTVRMLRLPMEARGAGVALHLLGHCRTGALLGCVASLALYRLYRLYRTAHRCRGCQPGPACHKMLVPSWLGAMQIMLCGTSPRYKVLRPPPLVRGTTLLSTTPASELLVWTDTLC